MNRKIYLCYDLKGIQSFIFAVPRLKYVCGGSALIDRFDRAIANALKITGAEVIFAGGGKGAFVCDSAMVSSEVKMHLIEKAHSEGLDICFGEHADYSEAANLADQTYPFLPEPNDLDGHPCQESGLYPVSRGKIHSMIQRRIWQKGDRLDRYFEEKLLKGLDPVPGMADELEFLHDVGAEEVSGRAGAAALGNRNRWAVIAMDGNDMGNQHRKAGQKFQNADDSYRKWLRSMSQKLDQCSHESCRQAIQRVIRQWVGTEEGEREMRDATKNGVTTLPIRPLVVGGDDIIILCHVRHALDFVFEACRVFESTSSKLNEELRNEEVELWPATGGRLSISAGVLYAPVTLPLATAIPYAEQLLRSAKNRGRRDTTEQSDACPAPPSLDWESVTEGVLESLPTRRQSEMRFLDSDINEIVELTRRPYTINELSDVLKLAERYREIPSTIRHRVLVEMQAGFWDRRVFCGRLAKTQKKLMNDLEEGANQTPCGRWQSGISADGTTTRSTDVIDALLLLEEDHRISQQTTGATA